MCNDRYVLPVEIRPCFDVRLEPQVNLLGNQLKNLRVVMGHEEQYVGANVVDELANFVNAGRCYHLQLEEEEEEE